MTKVTFEITMSLDGLITGPDISEEHPLGVGGDRLHEWMVGLPQWREMHGEEGGEEGVDSDLVEELTAASGAVVMGRGMFGGGDGPWGDEPWQGWWGDEPPFGKPVFVLTHHEREPLVLGATTFTFVTGGVESALEQAAAAAGGKDVAIVGGANVVQQFLKAGLVDELTLHVSPFLMGEGTRLFDDLGRDRVELEGTRVIQSPAVTHLTYRVVK